MKKFTYLIAAIVLISGISITTPSFAVKHVVMVGNFFFNPVNVGVNVGDTMRWVWSAGNHTTTSGVIPAGAATWDAIINSTHTSFEYKVTVAGSYAYVCTPHAPDMAGTFIASAIAPTLSISPANRNVPASAGTTTFNVTSNSSWTANSNAAWCIVTTGGTGNGIISAIYSENTSVLPRLATITVAVNGLTSQTVTVTQASSNVGIEDQPLSDLQIYPNPTKGIFKFRSGIMKERTLDVSIIDISGKTVLTRVCSGADDYTFDISQNPEGCYFVRINSAGSTLVKRIVLIE